MIWKCGQILLAAMIVSSAVNAAPTLTVMTYNIHHGAGADGKLDLERIAQIIESCKADVVCLQELDRNLPRTEKKDFPAWFEERLGMKGVFGCNYRFDGGEYGVATFTKLPVISSETTSLPNPKKAEPRGCLRVTLVWDGREVDVFNTHFGLKGEERKLQAESLLKLISENRPVILAGDMNENIDAPGLILLCQRFEDALASGQGKRIDHVLVTRDVLPISSQIIDNEASRTASDHLPRVAVLRWR